MFRERTPKMQQKSAPLRSDMKCNFSTVEPIEVKFLVPFRPVRFEINDKNESKRRKTLKKKRERERLKDR